MSEELKQVADLITANTIFCSKEVLTSDEAAKYLGISKSYLYKLTMGQKIPHYKPMGKMCYFNRLELEQWLQNNRIATEAELSRLFGESRLGKAASQLMDNKNNGGKPKGYDTIDKLFVD